MYTKSIIRLRTRTIITITNVIPWTNGKSREVIPFTSARPIPGILNIVSKITPFPTTAPNTIPKIVMYGSNALRSA